MNGLPDIMHLSIPPLIVGCFVFLFIIVFIFLYFLPALKLGRDLAKAKKALLPFRDKQGVVDKHLVETALNHSKILLHAWHEYKHTLHPQYESLEGESRLKSLRATAPAEMFFNVTSVVDITLHTEFFKHLPGILTGAGIIGTFCGLIIGLQNFNVDIDPAKLTTAVRALLKSVWEAFLASGFAIFAAIVVTTIEKFLLTKCYGQLEEIVQLIDGFYKAGAGEEYLASLVESARESATQTRQLKDGLVNDLKSLLENYSATLGQVFRESLENHSRDLVNAQKDSQKELSTVLPGAIVEGLAKPMDRIADGIRVIGGDQSQAVGDLLSAILERLDASFGGQIRNLNNLMEKNATMMESLQAGFSNLLDSLKQTSASASADLAGHLKELMTDMESRQEEMNGAMRTLIEEMRASAEEERGQSETRLRETLESLTNTVNHLLNDLVAQRQVIGEAGQQGLSELQKGLSRLIEEVSAASRNTGSAYETELKRLLEMAGERQRELGAEVQDLVKEMRSQQTAQHHETAERLQHALASIAAMVEQSGKESAGREETRARSDADRATRLDQAVCETIILFTEKTSTLAEKVKQAVDALAGTINNLERVTVRGSSGLNEAADQLLDTAVQLESAGKEVSTILERSSALQANISDTARVLENASRPLQEAIRAHQDQQEQITRLLDTLRGLIDEAGARAGVSRELVDEMSNMVDHARELQIEANQYLGSVNNVLQTGCDSFADAVTRNMAKTRAEFDKGLSEAVKMISSQVQELESALDKLVRAAGRER